MPFLSSVDSTSVNIPDIFSGKILLFNESPQTQGLSAWALHCFKQFFDENDLFNVQETMTKQRFAERASQVKKLFTNNSKTHTLLEELIKERYEPYRNVDLFYDVPRLRIIPTSDYLNTGISYNYKPHRDTWYGAPQEQINHWLAVKNVTKESTFFIAPTYFDKTLENTSSSFDLDAWDKKYRPVAIKSSLSGNEDRPHPVPNENLSNEAKFPVIIPRYSEVCFSGHHLHGSLSNSSKYVRLSIDYRICVPSLGSPPLNIDDNSTGDYMKYMIKHPHFSNSL